MMHRTWVALTVTAVNVSLLLCTLLLLRPSNQQPHQGSVKEEVRPVCVGSTRAEHKSQELSMRTCVRPSATPMAIPSHAKAQDFVENVVPTFLTHLKWQLSPGVSLPGLTDDSLTLMATALSFTKSIQGITAMDIGTVNGCAAFELERRGASTVFAVDITSPRFHGFEQLHSLLSSQVTFLRVRCYELPALFEPNSFDFIQFSGVMYHLRHPLVAVDAIYTLLKPGGIAAIETAIADTSYTHTPDVNPNREDSDWIKFVNYFKHTTTEGKETFDYTNWFFPSVKSLSQWFTSSGFEVLWSQAARSGTRGQLVVRKSVTERSFVIQGYKVHDVVRPALLDPIGCED